MGRSALQTCPAYAPEVLRRVPVRARKVIRKMRGGTQAHLILAEDGHHYVLKSINNPQHRRVLVNEWLSSALLRYLGIFVPDTALIQTTADFVAAQPDFYISKSSRRETIPAGIHFGSRLAVDPERFAIFDFLPDKTLKCVENRADFLGMLVFDKWVGNTDSRQAVFFRARGRGSRLRRNAAIYAQMIDHGFAFNGHYWTYEDSPLGGAYFRTCVYDEVRSLDSFQPWLDKVRHFPPDAIDSARKEIPPEWLDGDEEEFERMLERLVRRRSHVGELIVAIHRSRPTAFAKWVPLH